MRPELSCQPDRTKKEEGGSRKICEFKKRKACDVGKCGMIMHVVNWQHWEEEEEEDSDSRGLILLFWHIKYNQQQTTKQTSKKESKRVESTVLLLCVLVPVTVKIILSPPGVSGRHDRTTPPVFRAGSAGQAECRRAGASDFRGLERGWSSLYQL